MKDEIKYLAHMLDECDCGGDCGCTCCGDGGSIGVGDVLGGCDHSSGTGYMGSGCFHVPFPASPTIYRYGWTTKKSKKKYKNPYVGKIKIITAESDGQQELPASDYYLGSALKEFTDVTKDQPTIYSKVLYFNRTLELAWLVQKNGILVMYKPCEEVSGKWNITKTYLNKSGQIVYLDKKGEFETQNDALYYVWKMAQTHQDLLKEKCVNEQHFSPKDIMNWEAHGRDPRYFPGKNQDNINITAIQHELKAKFFNQFETVRLSNLGGTWKAEFTVKGLDSQIIGQQRVKTVIPLIDRIVSLMRIRGIQTNQYNISAVPA